MTRAAISEEILRLDRAICQKALKVDSSLIRPLNIETIKRTYSDEDPEFQYAEIPDMSANQQDLKNMRFPNTPEGKLLSEKRAFLITKAKMIEAIGTGEFNSFSERLYKPPTRALIRQAEELVTKEGKKQSPKIPLQEAQRLIKQAFDRLELPWRVHKLNLLTADASVMASVRVFNIKRKPYFSRHFIDRMLIHEIGTHVLRAENGRLQPMGIFLHGLPDYLATEEGLAVYNEERFGLLDNAVLRTYAGRVLAVDAARTGSFSDVVERLKEYFPEKKAITLAIRAKRGITDGSQSGGYTKDVVYLDGYLRIKRFVEQGGDLNALYVGKIGLQHLKLVKEFSWLRPPKYLPEMLQ